ncbi:hypothetical protein F511_33399 [Dorcoceras hygrometricum]|uniref:Uncharacterized protein n=1 Tax=Dorcoceras hygrometricum TaxID=472368 RepID=A0A2Z7B7N3_9LAMI|nr:hypothetical protein F511_33399 [Dorcoceras hygrometricum]
MNSREVNMKNRIRRCLLKYRLKNYLLKSCTRKREVESGISDDDVSYISRQQDGSAAMMTSAVMSSQSAVDKGSARDGAASFNS